METQLNSDQTPEIWQVETGGQIFETTLHEMTTWIGEGSLLKIDRVRKGNLRWIEAGKVPALLAVFNAKEAGEPVAPPVVTLTKLGPATIPGSSFSNPQNLNRSPLNRGVATRSEPQPTVEAEPVCSVHADAPAAYVCETCANLFCKACPNSYGGTVKVCPFCGAMCSSLSKVAAEINHAAAHEDLGVGFGMADFFRALAYPFRFKTSLIMGALMYAFVSLGQGAMGFGGIYMLSGALACFLAANTLTFGILSNTVENFSQGKIGLNFMPSFEDFSIWDDVVHPFFLSIGVYIVSFGPLIALFIASFFLILNPAVKQMNGFQSDAAQTVSPEVPYAAKSVQQADKLKQFLQKTNEEQRRRVAAMQDRERSVSNQVEAAEDYDTEIQPDQSYRTSLESDPDILHNPSAPKKPAATPGIIATADQEEEDFNRTNQLIQQQRKAQLEMAVGKTPETKASEQAEMIKQILRYGIAFILLGGLCLIWGLLYFPAACAVAGYTRSFSATVNPTVGFDTIKHLGVDYVKILLMALSLSIMSGIVSVFLNAVFSAFDMPSVGNLPARAIGSIFGFYFSVVFSCILGFALFKAADRLKLFR